MSEDLEKLILSALRDLADDLEKAELREANAETVLFGGGGLLDSLALVQLIADLEAGISEKFDRDIVIADERAMSRNRSPFRTVATLRDYLAELLGET